MNELERSCGMKDLSSPTLVPGSPARLCCLLVEVCGFAVALSLQSAHCFNFSYLEPGLVPSNQLSLVKGQSRLLATGAFGSALLSPVRKETSCCCLLTFQERCGEAGWHEGHLQHQELTSLCVLLTRRVRAHYLRSLQSPPFSAVHTAHTIQTLQ